MVQFAVLPGTPGLNIHDVAHVIIPGRGRRATGEDLSVASYNRVVHAATLYRAQDLDKRGGRIICSGYKTPGDTHGQPWSPPDRPTETFVGIPESDLMRDKLISQGITPSIIYVERRSIDTVTNFARSEREGYFGDNRPVAIVAQIGHLTRIIDIVAPKTLRRDFLGVVVPEDDVRDKDGMLPRLASRAILFGISPHTPDLIDLADRRATHIWQIALGAQK